MSINLYLAAILQALWNLQIFLKSIRLKILFTKLTTDLTCQRYSKDRFLISFLGMLGKLWENCCVVLEKFMACHMLCLDYFSHGKGHLTAQDMFAQCSWIYQKPIPVSSWFTYCKIGSMRALNKTNLYLLIDYLSNWKDRKTFVV